ncbi:Acetylornithine deacetylase [Lactococcus cremoris]|nr:Acetylornithine deacetylase [Lactococcus cremoris]
MANIEQIFEELKTYKNSQLHVPTFVVTSIYAGDEKSPNKTADFADLVVDCRLTPELELVFEQVMTDLADKYHFTYEDIVTPVLSTLTDNQAPFIQLLTDLSGAQTTGPQALMTKDFLKMLESEQLFLGLVSMTNVILLMSIFYWKS